MNQLLEEGFIKIAEYIQQGDSIQCNIVGPFKKKQKFSLTYCLVAGDTVRYIGKSIQGISRPTSYHKNNVMTTVRDGIKGAVEDGPVEVYAFISPTVEFKGIQIDVCEAYEQSLIRKYIPIWNNHIQK